VIATENDIDLSLLSGFFDGIRPDPVMTVSQWADAKRILPATSPEPGPYKTSRTPYAREIMDKLSVNDPASKIVVMKGSQVGFTELANNWIGYIIDVSPANTLYLMPTDALMKKTVKERIEKMLDSTPDLAAKTPKKRAKDSLNTLLHKEFPGMFLNCVGANSPVGLSSFSAKNVYGDEIDRMPDNVGNEGSPVELSDTRTSFYGNRSKRLLTSTPTIKGTSLIEAEFEATGQRYYNVPCPHCNHKQVLEFERLRYEPGKYDDVQYQCSFCNELIPEHKKTWMLANGEWIAKYPDKEDGYTFGYHLGAIYAPYGTYSWRKMVADYEKSRNDINKKKVFVNTKLGLSFSEEEGEKPDWKILFDRAEDYKPGEVFSSVVFITAGVDVQPDRLEVEIVGWMKGKTTQSIDYKIFMGDTKQADVWKQLDKVLNTVYKRQGDGAEMPIRLMAVDTGYAATTVYEYTKRHTLKRVVPIKGRDALDRYYAAPAAVDIVKSGKKIGRVKVWGVGVSFIKSEVYGYLKLRIDSDTGEIPEGYCHFPQREANYFRGITAEELVMGKNKRGYEKFIWQKSYQRNEPLDCRVYARAAASMVGMDNWDDAKWAKEMFTAQPLPVVTQNEKGETVSAVPVKKTKKKKTGGSSGFW
jgi:phage terminase large subunit GpA-like protein